MNKSQQVAHYIAKLIIDSGLKRTDALPPLRRISTDTGVSVFAVRKGVELLVECGVIEAQWGNGCYVKNDSTETLKQVMDDLENARPCHRHLRWSRPREAGSDLVSVILSANSPSFYGSYLAGASAVLGSEDYYYILSLTAYSQEGEYEEVQSILKKRLVRGFVIAPAVKDEPPEYIHDIRAAGLPVVLIGDLDMPAGAADEVGCDNYAGMRMVMAHLFEMGHRKIVFAGSPNVRSVGNRSRYNAYRDAMREKNLEAAEIVPVAEMSSIQNPEDLSEILGVGTRGTTAVACANDLVALTCMRSFRAMGLRVPEDVSVTGFDDREHMEHTNPPLTTVRYPRHRIAQKAARILLDRISEGREPQSYQRVVVEPRLVLRQSVCRNNQ